MPPALPDQDQGSPAPRPADTQQEGAGHQPQGGGDAKGTAG